MTWFPPASGARRGGMSRFPQAAGRGSVKLPRIGPAALPGRAERFAMRPLRLLLAILLIVSAACAARGGELLAPRPTGGQRRLRQQPDRAKPGRRHAAGTDAGRTASRRGHPQAGLGAAAAAWESRIALGDASPAQWLALAEAQLAAHPAQCRSGAASRMAELLRRRHRTRANPRARVDGGCARRRWAGPRR